MIDTFHGYRVILYRGTPRMIDYMLYRDMLLVRRGSKVHEYVLHHLD